MSEIIIIPEKPKHSRFIDLSGQVIGRLTVLAYTGRTIHRESLWQCVCTCGVLVERVHGNSLRWGKVKSCGCLQREWAKQKGASTRIHGKAGTRIYNIWARMKQRCHNSNYWQYKNYGGRGIVVCDRWRSSFEAFTLDVGERPSPLHTIDRIDNDGNYEPGNVRWATRKEQNRNRRSNLVIEWNGEKRPLVEWAEILGFSYGALVLRLGHYKWSVERAFTQKMRASRLR